MVGGGKILAAESVTGSAASLSNARCPKCFFVLTRKEIAVLVTSIADKGNLREEGFELTVQRYSQSIMAGTGGRSMKQLVTVPVQSASREQGVSVFPFSFLCKPGFPRDAHI